jgi:hypothetical protein
MENSRVHRVWRNGPAESDGSGTQVGGAHGSLFSGSELDILHVDADQTGDVEALKAGQEELLPDRHPHGS